MKKIALRIVQESFYGKKDKGGNIYLHHLERVSENAIQYFNYPDNHNELQVIGLLHDLIEDCPNWTIKKLKESIKNDLIVEAVQLLTKQKGVDYNQYIQNIKSNKFSRAVKLADLKDNMDLTRLPIITEKDIERLKKYHKSYMFLLND